MKIYLFALLCGVFSSLLMGQGQPHYLEKFVLSVQKSQKAQKTKPSSNWDPLLKKIPQWLPPSQSTFSKLSLTRSPQWAEIGANPQSASLKKEDIDRLSLEVSQLPGAERNPCLPLVGWLYFAKGWYPESLQVVHQMAQIYPETAVLYDAIQAIYGAQQKAGGNTALQAL